MFSLPGYRDPPTTSDLTLPFGQPANARDPVQIEVRGNNDTNMQNLPYPL